MNVDRSVSYPTSLLPQDKRFSIRRGKKILKTLASIEGLFALAEEALIKMQKLDYNQLVCCNK